MSTQPADLVFVGGTGRSGTHILSYLLDRHPRFHGVPIECRFHCNPKGLADVVRGRTEPEDFLRKQRGYWWHRDRIEARYAQALERLEAAGARCAPLLRHSFERRDESLEPLVYAVSYTHLTLPTN